MFPYSTSCTKGNLQNRTQQSSSNTKHLQDDINDHTTANQSQSNKDCLNIPISFINPILFKTWPYVCVFLTLCQVSGESRYFLWSSRSTDLWMRCSFYKRKHTHNGSQCYYRGQYHAVNRTEQKKIWFVKIYRHCMDGERERKMTQRLNSCLIFASDFSLQLCFELFKVKHAESHFFQCTKVLLINN